MKTINKFLSLILILTLSSCLVDDDVRTDSFDQGPNIVGFSRTAIPASVSADGNTSIVEVPLTITGPTSVNMTQDVSVTVSVDPASTAVADTHFQFETTTVTLTSDNNYSASVPVTILTEGINPPLDESPVLKLAVTSVSGDNLVISGRTGESDITINYLCYSDLEGTYTNNLLPDCNGSGGGIATVTLDSPGRYWVSSMARYRFVPDICIGFYMIDVCGVLTYDGGDLEDNGYDGDANTPGQVSPDNQSFTFTFQLPAAGYGPEEITYTRQ